MPFCEAYDSAARRRRYCRRPNVPLASAPDARRSQSLLVLRGGHVSQPRFSLCCMSFRSEERLLQLLYLGVLRVGFFEDGDAGVGVFP